MNPFPAWLQKLWSAWDIRAMVIGSLILQIILIYFGDRRKNIRGIWIKSLVWSTYLMADAAAIFSLGKISDASKNEDTCGSSEKSTKYSNGLMIMWAPILLLHLGGPDTITAYSIEDVQLWLRHALNLVFQVTIAIYVFLRFWTGKSEWAAFLTLPLFVAGIAKYGERTWVLWCTNSVFPKPLLPIEFNDTKIIGDLNSADGEFPEAKLVMLSYLWLKAMAPCILHSGSFVTKFASSEVTTIIWNKGHDVNKTFKFFEIQLGFMYDVLYTKANQIYTRGGFVVRCVSLFCVTGALLGFILMSKRGYEPVDIPITYILLVGAVILEIYAILVIMCSDFAIVWMCKHCKNSLVRFILRYLSPLLVSRGKRWARSLPTLNVLNLVFDEIKPSMLRRVVRYYDKEDIFKAYMCQIDVYELEPLKLIVMKQVKSIFHFFRETQNWDKYFSTRGELSLNKHRNHKSKLEASIKKPLDVSIVIWHIVTTCIYYSGNIEDDPAKKSLREASKLLSDYMMYLVVNYPSMLGEHVSSCNLSALSGFYVDLMEQAKKDGIKSDADKASICAKMIKCVPNVCTRNKSGNSPSLEYAKVPIEAHDLMATLMISDCKDDKWEIISDIWSEMLFHGAATNGIPIQHLQMLRRGGEFISQVWLLLFINGLSSPSPRDFLRPLFGNVLDKT